MGNAVRCTRLSIARPLNGIAVEYAVSRRRRGGRLHRLPVKKSGDDIRSVRSSRRAIRLGIADYPAPQPIGAAHMPFLRGAPELARLLGSGAVPIRRAHRQTTGWRERMTAGVRRTVPG